MKNVLFVTWDGPDVFYLETLFLPIFDGLRKHGYKFHVLQFSWAPKARIAEITNECTNLGIPFKAARIRRGPGWLGPFATAVFGERKIKRLLRAWDIDILMPRSLMPALACLTMGEQAGIKVAFDADGLDADERVDFRGLSPVSATYRVLRDIEAQIIRKADVVLTRTACAAEILLARAGSGTLSSKFHLVANGRDPKKFGGPEFSSSPQRTVREHNRDVKLVYVGSLGEQYRFEEMLQLACLLKKRQPTTTFTVITPHIETVKMALQCNIDGAAQWTEYRTVAPDEVATILSNSDFGLALRKKSFSTSAVAPIKIGEYLLAGLPVIGTHGVGDVGGLVEEGVFFPLDGDMSAAVEWMLNIIANPSDIRQRCRQCGVERFSLQSSVDSYINALRSL